MKDYLLGVFLGFVILGGTAGYYYRENFPRFTRYIHSDILKHETEWTKAATGISGGFLAGFIAGIPAALVIDYLIIQMKNKPNNS